MLNSIGPEIVEGLRCNLWLSCLKKIQILSFFNLYYEEQIRLDGKEKAKTFYYKDQSKNIEGTLLQKCILANLVVLT